MAVIKVRPYKNCHIVEGVGRRRRPEFVRMIEQYGNTYGGWTNWEVNRDFWSKVMEPVGKMIRQRTASFAPTDMQRGGAPISQSQIDEMVEKRISKMFAGLGLKPEDMSKLVDLRSTAEESVIAQREAEAEALGDDDYEQATGDLSAPISGAGDETEDQVTPGPTDDLSNAELNRMSKEELLDMAKLMNLDTDGLKRNDLIKAIATARKSDSIKIT